MTCVQLFSFGGGGLKLIQSLRLFFGKNPWQFKDTGQIQVGPTVSCKSVRFLSQHNPRSAQKKKIKRHWNDLKSVSCCFKRSVVLSWYLSQAFLAPHLHGQLTPSFQTPVAHGNIDSTYGFAGRSRSENPGTEIPGLTLVVSDFLTKNIGFSIVKPVKPRFWWLVDIGGLWSMDCQTLWEAVIILH